MTYGLTHAEVVDWIQARRKEQGLTIRALAARSRVDARTIHRNLSNSNKHHHAALAKVVQALGGRLRFEYDILESEAAE